MKTRFAKLFTILMLLLSICVAFSSCGNESVAVIDVKYSLNGGTLPETAPESYEKGAAPDFSKVIPTKDFYEFGGWYSDAKLTTPFDAEATTTEKVTIYAKWVAKQFNIEYELDGGYCADLPTKHTYGERTVLASFTPTKEDYIFVGWFDDPSFTSSLDIINNDCSKDIKAYAKWNPAFTKVSDIPNVTKGYFGAEYDTLRFDVSKYVNNYGIPPTYSVSSSNPDVVSATIDGSLLTLKFLQPSGDSNITLDVIHGSSKILTFEFNAAPKMYKRIACVGASHTAKNPAYPFSLEPILNDLGITIGNFGKSGASVSKYTNNDNYGAYHTYGKAEYEASLNFNADLIIILFGVNDATKVENGVPKFDWNEVAPAYKEAFISLIETYKTTYPNADIVLMTSVEIMDDNTLSISNELVQNHLYPLQIEVAKATGIKLLDLRAHLKTFSDKSVFFGDDGVHFTEFGADTIAEFVLKSI